MAEKLASIKKVGGGIKCWKTPVTRSDSVVSKPNYRTFNIKDYVPIWNEITIDNLLLVCNAVAVASYNATTVSSSTTASISAYDPTTGNVTIKDTFGYYYGCHEYYLYYSIYAFNVPLSEIMQN